MPYTPGHEPARAGPRHRRGGFRRQPPRRAPPRARGPGGRARPPGGAPREPRRRARPDRVRRLRPRRGGRGRRCAARSAAGSSGRSTTSPGLASVRRSFDDIRRTLEVNAFATLNLLGALLRQGTLPRLLLVGSAEEYGAAPAGRRRGARRTRRCAREPLRAEQGLAGGARGVLREDAALARAHDADLQPHRSPPGAGLRLRRLRAADRPHRAAPGGTGDPRGQPRRGAGLPRRARRGPRLPPRDRAGRARGGLQRLLGGRAGRSRSCCRPCSGSRGDQIKVEVDVSRHRPIDVPVLHGDPGRLARDTGWAPAIAIERTLARPARVLARRGSRPRPARGGRPAAAPPA